MSKSTFAVLLTVLVIFIFTMTGCSTKNYETNTYEVTEDFNKILIDVDTAGITLLPSDDGTCKVVCYEQEEKKHSVEVNDGTLAVKEIDDREWYDYVGINTDRSAITVYLPDVIYDSIVIEENTGDVCLENLSVSSLNIAATTGHVTVSNITCHGDITIGVSTGKINLSDVECKNLISTGGTGNVMLKNVIATEKISIEISTGDVIFEGSDGAEIYVTTDTGDIKGSLLTEKVFIVRTDTGRINVPDSITGGRCQITTDTGNINISICGD